MNFSLFNNTKIEFSKWRRLLSKFVIFLFYAKHYANFRLVSKVYYWLSSERFPPHTEKSSMYTKFVDCINQFIVARKCFIDLLIETIQTIY